MGLADNAQQDLSRFMKENPAHFSLLLTEGRSQR
jgi:hypothetical protein